MLYLVVSKIYILCYFSWNVINSGGRNCLQCLSNWENISNEDDMLRRHEPSAASQIVNLGKFLSVKAIIYLTRQYFRPYFPGIIGRRTILISCKRRSVTTIRNKTVTIRRTNRGKKLLLFFIIYRFI